MCLFAAAGHQSRSRGGQGAEPHCTGGGGDGRVQCCRPVKGVYDGIVR